MNSKEMIKEILEKAEAFHMNDLPDIDLYMDQVTTYLNNKFSDSKRHDDDKLLTKTMINNYTKSKLLPAPDKKKYSKDHLFVISMIYFFKNILSINDIQTIMEPLIKEHFHNEDEPLEETVNKFLNSVQSGNFSQSILDECEPFFKNNNNQKAEQINTVELISTLCYDIFVRKLIIEKLIDSLPTESDKIKETR